MYSKKKRSWVKHLDFTLVDILCMMLALLIAYVWRFEWNLDLDTNVNVDLYIRMAIMLILIDIFVKIQYIIVALKGVKMFPASGWLAVNK